MHVSLAQAAIAPGRTTLVTTSHQTAETSWRAEPGTLTAEEIRNIVIEILG
ncbi:hypothetical protein [Falsiroseomonas bella]|uniref:hypothetical protein n=1 Tax=Falsiroseomonas bella TaxID=2184016 RepID=UPI0013050171|nr:hypothetical protein [Falsiroseomonas bella]